MIEDLLRYRGYIWHNAVADLRYRYAGSGLGWLWLVLVPLAQIAIYSIVFAQVMQARLPSLIDLPFSFTVYLCVGLLPYLGFADTLNRCTASLLTNSRHIARAGLPELVILAREALAGLMTTLLSVALLLIVSLPLGFGPNTSWLCVPIVIVLLIALAYGLGIGLGVLNVFSRDVAQVVAVLLQLWLWATPIVYVESVLPPAIREYLSWNPLYVYVTSLHSTVLFGEIPRINAWFEMGAWSAVACVTGFALLRRLQPELRDVL